ncbi:hypothetical protein [Halorussus pelagicus]|uniref:hypothetical protein n=1 Tax=Halorussus pelagicus TaxID=2505977 RepID=UPI001FB7D9DF|nr:hypothetical protein [Halorussus pelagicus]
MMASNPPTVWTFQIAENVEYSRLRDRTGVGDFLRGYRALLDHDDVRRGLLRRETVPFQGLDEFGASRRVVPVAASITSISAW